MSTSHPNRLQASGQQVLEVTAHNSSAFMQMRAKPAPANFSSKALSFYSNDPN